MKMNKIIISGCSYSTNTGVNPYGDIINKTTNISVENKAWPGQSNKSIIRLIRNSIKDGITNSLFICQLTHLHRLNLYCTLNQKYIDCQPMFINPIPEITNGNVEFQIDVENPHIGSLKGITTYGAYKQIDNDLPENIYSEFFEFYQNYLKYFYDDTESFNSLMESVDDLKRLVDTTNNEIIFLYWSHIIPNQFELEKRNFINFDNTYSMLEWSLKNNLLDGRTSHLSQEGHTTLSDNIIKKLNLKKQ